MKKRIAIALPCVALIAFASLALRAGNRNDFVFSPDGRTVWATHAPSHITMPPAQDAAAITIAGNLSRYPNATYFSVWGNTIAQGGANFPFQAWEAIAFTPQANATITQVEVSAGRQSSGVTGYELSIYNDAGGVPGTAIGTTHVSNIPIYGQCCDLAVVNDPAGLPVTAGTQYWVVVSTTPSDTDIYAWAFNSTDMRPQLSASWCKGTTTYCGNNSGKWVPYQYVQLGFAVLGH